MAAALHTYNEENRGGLLGLGSVSELPARARRVHKGTPAVYSFAIASAPPHITAVAQLLLRANRSLDVNAPIVIYRVVGRRASRVYVNDEMQPSRSGSAAQRLSEPVYWRTSAIPGDQLQERTGGILLVAVSGHCHRVRLTPPIPIEIETAFTHAERAIRADCVLIDTLQTEGTLVSGAYRRPQDPASSAFGRLLAEDHPLVVDEAPSDLAAQTRRPRNVSGQWRQIRVPASRTMASGQKG